MIIVSSTGAETIGHGDETITANSRGEFDVPQELGEHLIKFDGWRSPAEGEEAVEESSVIKELRARIVELEAEVLELQEVATGGRHEAPDDDKTPKK
jgi:hypothetical protein